MDRSPQSRDTPQAELKNKDAELARVYDVAIVGGGPAGLSAGLWLGRYLRSVVLVDGGDPRNWETRKVNGFLGRKDVTPAELRTHGRDECRRFGVVLVDDEVAKVRRIADDRLELTLGGGGQVTAARMLLAFGLKDVWPDIEGLERCYGETVHVCPDCDGYEARGQKIVVIGSGRKVAAMALALATWTDQIIICTHGEKADIAADLLTKLDAAKIPILDVPIRRMYSRDRAIHTLELDNGMELNCDRVFFNIGQFPADDLGTQLGCKRDERGQIETDYRGATSVPNVFAAGDITPGPQLAIGAAASGATAALSIHRSLLPEMRRPD